MKRSQTIVTVLLFGLYLLAYGPIFPALVQEWYDHVTYSYAFLILPISVYLVWIKRRTLARLPVRPKVFGIVPFVGVTLIAMIGHVLGDVFVVRVSMLLTLGAIVYLSLGEEILKTLLFPLGYLFLMIPAPYVFIKHLSHYLRFLDAIGASAALELVGIPNYRDGYFLHLPAITLEVADVCSGVSSIFALVALVTLYAYFLHIRVGFKMLLAFSAIPFAVLVNLFRIILVSISVHYYGPVMLGAFFHHFTGTFIFALSFFLTLAFGEYLRRKSSLSQPVVASDEADADREWASTPAEPLGSTLSPYLALAVLTAILGYSLYGSPGRAKIISSQSNLQALADSVGPYSRLERDSDDGYHDPTADSEAFQVYEGPNESRIEVYVGYKRYQSSTDRLLSPKLHFPEGWNFVWVRSDYVKVSGAEPIQANWMLTQKGKHKRLVLYWYQIGEATFSGELRFRLEQAKNIISNGRKDGAVIRLSTAVQGEENLMQEEKSIRDLVFHLYPELRQLLSSQAIS